MGNVQDAPLMADVCVKFVGSERVQTKPLEAGRRDLVL